jgi:hypothetical protein
VIKKLTSIGDGLRIAIEQPSVEQLGIGQDIPVEVRTDGDSLRHPPVTRVERERIREAAERLMARHDETLQKLAR